MLRRVALVAPFALAPLAASAAPPAVHPASGAPEGSSPASEAPSASSSGVPAAAAPTVRVEGSRRATRDPTLASYVLRGDELRAPGADAAELVARAPGVQVARSGASPDLATASLRGATSAQTPVYLAGIRLNDELTGVADLSVIPVSLLDRVEVYRGAVPAFADRSGIGGAVFFEPRLATRAGAELTLGGGSYGEFIAQGGVHAGGARARASTYLRASYSQNDYPVRDDRGTVTVPGDDRVFARPNAQASSLELLHVSRYELGAGAQLTAVASLLTRQQGVTGLGALPAAEARAALTRGLVGVAARLPHRLGLTEVTTSVAWSEQRLLDPRYELSLLAAEVHSAAARLAQGARVSFRLGEAARLDVRAVGESELLGVARDGATTLRAHRWVGRLAADGAVRPLSWLELVAVAALDCHHTSASGVADASTTIPRDGVLSAGCGVLEPTGRVGARADVGPASLVLNVSRAVRVPTLGELFGTSVIVRGNPQLAREEAWSADLGARLGGAFGPVEGELDVYAFARFSSGLVAWQRSSLGAVRPYNVGAARALGVEASGTLRALGVLEASLSATLLDPRDVSAARLTSSDLLPYLAPLVLAPSLTAHGSPFASVLVGDLRASTRLLYRSARVADPAGLVRLAEQASWDVEASAELFARTVTLRAAARNLLDFPQEDVVGYPLAGRTFHLSAEGAWR